MIKPLSTVLKSLLLCAALAASALALALPTPKDIETAVSQGHITQAESMLREVIAAKPQSAKAHYELAQVLLRENRTSEAHTELKQAQAIDPSLKFASSDKHFQDLLERTQAPTPAPHPASVQALPPATAPSGNGFSLTYVWIGIAALGVIALLIRMNRPAPQPAGNGQPAPVPVNSPSSTAFGRNPSPGYAPAAGTYPTAGYPSAPASGGSTVAGAVVGGLAGVAAGYALSKALEGDHHNAPPAQAPASNTWADNQGYVSAEPAGNVPDFDPGTGADWDDNSGGDSGGGSDDSW
jgi:hypothetical protein